MASHNHKRAGVLVARSKRTGERYPVRTSHLAGAYNSPAIQGWHADRLHYLGNSKWDVCRCNRSSHSSHRQVHNEEIEGLCHHFFLMHTTETICSREQWRAVETETVKVPKRSSTQKMDNYQSVNRWTYSKKEPFEYDSSSVGELLAVRDRRSLGSGIIRSNTTQSARSSRSRPLSLDLNGKRRLSHGTDGEADIPENVWRLSRPSVYIGIHNTESILSTPLGSSVKPAAQGTYFKPSTQNPWYSTHELSARTGEVRSRVDSWYGLAHSPGAFALDSASGGSDQQTACYPRHKTGYFNTACGIKGPQMSSSERPRRSTGGSVAANTDSDHVVELPSSKTAVELDTIITHSSSHNSLRLRELEDRRVENVSELAGPKPTVPSMTCKRRTSPR
ncbi:uncharacterized protein M421DRAFT_406807 [Didymella exigua CBS 183.55]|uniref:Uncharacterized protein n=1 Tax=Didymella exigua CBS 183.55 TaxID=1150837 RepID=A0A6A5R8P8_9PLEO|nr:uncharacterized protein M421DRAFT_406807 [Didymella exigua CBS 183.55]KAF1923344.1 hypothetical protein M421DRAFT_406807 [Didymella exigua CBS 183.55]